MNNRISRFGLGLIVLSLTVVASAQTVEQEPQLKSLPKLETRPANERHMFGTKMAVYVSVDAKGNVRSIESIQGPGWICSGVELPQATVLRKAAAEVALKAKFSPAVADGQRVASRGIVDIEFPVFTARATAEPKSSLSDPMQENVKTISGTVDSVGTSDTSSDDSGPVKTILGDVDLIRRDVEVGPAPSPKLSDITVSGGVLNGKALQLPKPAYPAAAIAVRASGAVAIKVLIDEGGTVLSAEAVSGHLLLRSASRNVACNARFAPTFLRGTPVNVSGVIIYNFVP